VQKPPTAARTYCWMKNVRSEKRFFSLSLSLSPVFSVIIRVRTSVFNEIDTFGRRATVRDETLGVTRSDIYRFLTDPLRALPRGPHNVATRNSTGERERYVVQVVCGFRTIRRKWPREFARRLHIRPRFDTTTIILYTSCNTRVLGFVKNMFSEKSICRRLTCGIVKKKNTQKRQSDYL